MCSPLSHTTKPQGERFSDSRGHYGRQPTTIQQALQREHFLQPLLAAPKHAHRLRECQQQCLTPGQTKELFVHHIPPARAPRPQPCTLCSKGSHSNHRAVLWVWFSFGFLLILFFLLLTLALPIRLGFFSQLYRIMRTVQPVCCASSGCRYTLRSVLWCKFIL